MVARDGASNGRHGTVVVETLQILVANLRNRCGGTVVGASEGTIDIPATVGRADARVDLGWRLAARLLSLPQRRGYADCCAGLVDALVARERQVCGARRGRRDVGGRVHGGARGRVLTRLAVCVLLVGCVLRDGSRGRVGGSHCWLWSGVWCVVCGVR